MIRVAFVVGARPNYMKVAPMLREIRERASICIEPILVHTGQHYDESMSDSFFRDLGMPTPDEFLGVGSDTQAKQMAKIMAGFDGVCDRRPLDVVVVVGDVNSTLGCALVAAKRGIKVVHVEAGLRSFDRTMPEEINRVLTDQISDLLLITSEDAYANLEREGVAREKVRFVGNPMIDSLQWALAKIGKVSAWQKRLGRGYIVATLHRPSNVDDFAQLMPIVEGLRSAARRVPVIFPVHPRTAKQFSDHGITLRSLDGNSAVEPGLYALPPLGYLEFLDLMRGASLLLTDSGGVQEETTVLGIPCATLRANTERPVTITLGTNELTPRSREGVEDAVERALGGKWKKGSLPPLWDGKAAGRIVDELTTLAD
ncbi:MAG: non-hydrolyzing UDP-N-acetylglucosamine 2-epimerase [Thermoanaerobaculia bacterium]